MDALVEILRPLCDALVVSGYEKTSENTVSKLIKKEGIKHSVDTLGNIIFKKDGTGDLTLMVVAHYDEVGFSVKYIDDDGYIYLSPVGGIDVSVLSGQRVTICHNEQHIPGIIGAQPIHMKNPNKNNSKSVDISDLWVDVGISDAGRVNDKVSIGDSVSFSPNFSELNDNLVSSKSLDNRAGVAALLSLFKRLCDKKIAKYKSIYFVASSQEELGMRGAKVAGYNINPDICIAIDATHATDYPTVNNKKYGNIKLGQGAVIPFGSNFDISLQRQLKDIAIGNGIAYQLDSIPSYSGTDIATIQVLKGGCRSGLISIPCRYMHTPSEVISVKDITSVVDILSNFVLM